MLSSTRLVLVITAALLQVGCEAWSHNRRQVHNRRNAPDASIALGTIKGQDIIPLPVLVINGPDVIIGFPDKCTRPGRTLSGTHVVVSNNNGGSPPILEADDADDALSNLSIQCDNEDDGTRCSDGVSVVIYQFCAMFYGPDNNNDSSNNDNNQPDDPNSSNNDNNQPDDSNSSNNDNNQPDNSNSSNNDPENATILVDSNSSDDRTIPVDSNSSDDRTVPVDSVNLTGETTAETGEDTRPCVRSG